MRKRSTSGESGISRLRRHCVAHPLGLEDPALRRAVTEVIDRLPGAGVEQRREALASVLEPNIAAIIPASDRIAVLRHVWGAIGELDADDDLGAWWSRMHAALPSVPLVEHADATDATRGGSRRRLPHRVGLEVG